jgi:hypothetical protein
MPKKSATEFMMNFVQEYLDGDMDRLSWDLNFNHYMIQYYPKMERENIDLAECFNFYLAELGFDEGASLSDSAYKKFIRKQFYEFKAVMRDGFC